MKLIAHPHDSFETLERRREIAYIVSKLMVGDAYSGSPSPKGGDTYTWAIDRQRYWLLQFDKDDPKVLSLKHYDNNKSGELSLLMWLAWNLEGHVELPSTEQAGKLEPVLSTMLQFLNKGKS